MPVSENFIKCTKHDSLIGVTTLENHLNIFLLQAYHSQIPRADEHLANFALLPLRTPVRGPAPNISNGEDIIDEAMYYFKANIFFRTYEIKVR